MVIPAAISRFSTLIRLAASFSQEAIISSEAAIIYDYFDAMAIAAAY